MESIIATSTQLSTSGEALFLPDRQRLLTSVDISTLFTTGVLTRCDHRDGWFDELTPVEKKQIGDVCEKRYSEFAAGRSQARQLIASLTGVAETLLIGSYRQPLWPKEVIGSISHSDEYCAVAVAPKSVLDGLGLDVEPFEDLDTDVAEVVLTDAEHASTAEIDAQLIRSGAEPMGGKAHKLIFSIKEAIYKCCYPKVQAFIDFKQCNVSLDVASQSYQAMIDCQDAKGNPVHMEISGKWLIEFGHIFAGAEYRA